MDEELIYNDIDISEEQEHIGIEETIEIIEVLDVPTYEIDSEVAFPALGETNEELRHQLLNGREFPDQHPITAITGLRDELDNIESLKTVYSDKRNQANYYLWEDENILYENRVGYFVSACSDINQIKLCTSDNDIFGVTVDGAGFIGAQSDIARGNKYGLVVTTGIVHVRCELSVNIGDYVISNDYGYAKSNKNGYKVVGRHQIDGVEYAEIILITPMNRICKLSDDVENVNDRMDQAEINIASAMNVANEAINKTENIENVSEEAIKNALEALDKANGVSEKTDSMVNDLFKVNETVEQAKAISEAAELSAEKIRSEAVTAANKAFEEAQKVQNDLNDLIREMSPLAQWEDETRMGIVGFVARANADSATLASLAEWKEDEGDSQSIAGTIAKVNEHEAVLNHITNHQGVNGSTIAQIEQKADDNEASITSLVASVDKYSVGEYSQAYGLTREQAESILKLGYVYIPTKNRDRCCEKHSNVDTHCEKFVDDDNDEINEFTPGNYYEWGINDREKLDWIEHKTSVIFSETIPEGVAYKYWYIDSDKSPAGYEPYALYLYDDDEWKKVNILSGNTSNRITSMIRQKTNSISLEVADAVGSVAALKTQLTNEYSTTETVNKWIEDANNNIESVSESLASIRTKAGNNEASIAQIVKNVGKDGEVTAASIVTAVNNDTGAITLNADKINLNGVVTANNNVKITTDGKIIATGGTIGSWEIMNGYLRSYVNGTNSSGGAFYLSSGSYDGSSSNLSKYWIYIYDDEGQMPFSLSKDGILTAKGAQIEGDSTFTGKVYATDGIFNGEITAKTGSIAGWKIGTTSISKETTYNNAKFTTSLFALDGMYNDNGNAKDVFRVMKTENGKNEYPFVIRKDGSLWATNAEITGKITAESGTIGGWHIDKTYIDSNGSNGRRFYLASADDLDGNWIVAKDSSGIHFQVSKDGYLSCNGANIKGYIEATGGIFNGTVYASGGSFTGTVNASYGNFANGVTIGNSGITAGSLRQLYRGAVGYTSDAVQIYRIEAGSGSVGGWGIDTEYLYSTTRTPISIGGVGGYGSARLSPSVVTAYFYTSSTASQPYSSIQEYWYYIAKAGKEYANSVSDLRAKNSISEFDDNYEILFDSLSPKRYKYNDGESNRYHTGFIAQDVVDAIKRSGLTTQDFAAVCLEGMDNDVGYWWLRRDEFVALNTWQIQKLKARVAELEEKIKRLEV